ncbi:MAG: arginase family protein [Candidatus Omnitrophota bacterium]|nr:arginase family protein [Candidatus Omnitrophota bacterium]
MISSVRILNFDDSITAQKNLVNRYKPEITDLRDLAPYARYWAGKNTVNGLRKCLPTEGNTITFLGSGDFHHISRLLINQPKEPISVIVFDGHPDWDIMPQPLCCGSWVNDAARAENVRKIILVGVSSDDPAVVERGKIEMYPYSRKPSLVFTGKIPFLKRIYWDEIKGKDIAALFRKILSRLPTRHVYVSIDKDCLRSEYAATNWEEGKLALDELLLMLKLIKENADIIGADIVGDYSPVYIKGIFKRFVAYSDHPKNIKARTLPLAEITAINEATNLKILNSLLF